MKLLPFLILSLLVCSAFSQTIIEKEIKTEVNEVTVFIEGAQIISKKNIDLTQGITLLKFTNLSPFIDEKSIQVKAEEGVSVLSVNHQQNFLNKLEKPKELIDLEQKILDIKDKINLEETYNSIINEEIAFLQANKNIGGKNQEVSVTNLKDAASFYSSRMTTLRLSEIEHYKTISNLNTQKNNIQNQINTLSSKKEFAAGEILVKVESSKTANVHFEISYLVKNASWYPSYDIRVDDITKPVEIVYKANLRQDTKVDWKNVKLRFSSTNPSISGVAPELKTYFLDYYSQPPVYNKNINSVSGKVTDTNMESLPGVNVLVEGTTIGTVSDINGNYSITLPKSASYLTFNYVGYKPKTMPVTNSILNVQIEEDLVQLNEVVVVGYGIQRDNDFSSALTGSVAGVNISNKQKMSKQESTSTATSINATPKINQTAVEFEIKTPYTVNSDNKNYSVDMTVVNLPATYTYYCIPKIDRNAFLQARIIDWEKYNLMEGEANVFFENTYIGKTLLDIRYATDTLSLSLGQDKNVNVNREKIKDFTTRQFLGSKKEETRAWQTTVKNNKVQKINMVILDQIPVSTLEEIEVSTQNSSGAIENKETGEIKWEFQLEPNSKKELELKYNVKYPKNRNLVIE
jgi:hypothetical protein